MRKPKASKEGRRPRLQIDVSEVMARAVGMAAARKGMSISDWVKFRITPFLRDDIMRAEEDMADDKDNYTDVG